VSARVIMRHAHVCGGAACIAGTRLPVWILRALWREGVSDEQILRAYPSLDSEKLTAAKQYAALNVRIVDRDEEASS